MFVLNPEIKKLEIEAEKVRFLYRSSNDMQVALPNHQAQRCSGFLCCYWIGTGCETVGIFQLQEDNELAFYVYDEEGDAPCQKDSFILDEGLRFFEAMGLMMGDLDFAILDPEQRKEQWESFPLKNGLTPRPKKSSEETAARNSGLLPVSPAEISRGVINNSTATALSVEETPELKPYQKCQVQRMELCQKLGRLLSSF